MIFSDKPKWKRIIMAVMCLSGILAIAGGSFAAYTSQASQRGVARNSDKDAVCFASNFLQSCANGTAESAYATKMAYFSEEQKASEELPIDLDVFNHANGNENLVNQRDNKYTLRNKFDKGSGSGYKVMQSETEVRPDENGIYELKNQTLTGRSASSHQYKLIFSGADLDKLRITVVAIPENFSVTNNQMLAAVIVPCVGDSTQSFGFDWQFIKNDGTSPGNYAGFNCEIWITSGQASGTITWRNDIVEIDPFSLEKMGKTQNDIESNSDTNTSSLTIDMDQSAGTGDYLIPFYIKDLSKIQNLSWEDMKKTVVLFEAKQKTNP